MAMEKTFNAATAEDMISESWAKADAFKMGAGAAPGAEPFCILLPPPNVTGSLHMGHAFNHTLMDILTRWHRMRGFDTLWQPGLDHAGIATQMVVERKMAEEGNIRRRDMSREDFIAKVWEWKAESGGMILEQCKRLGDSFDLSRNRFTMDEGFHDAVLKAFIEFYEKGLIYRGKRLVNWDPKFETAISDIEVENIEVDGHMWHFKYPLAGGATYEYVEKDEDGNVTLRETRDYISIATTRPETMLGDGAVAVHPKDERYAPIVGKLCEIPVGPKEHRRLIPIITDEYPDPDFGSGAVKITGAHDFNDYMVAKRNNIPLYSLMDTRGAMRDDGYSYEESAEIAKRAAEGEDVGDVSEVNLVPEELRGLDRFEARKQVVAAITDEGLAVMTETSIVDEEDGTRIELVPLVENKKIMQPFGDRSKVVIEPMLTDQWFVDAEKLAGPALEAVKSGKTRIYPEAQEKDYYRWLENIEPWCISRQLWWGHQIPVWYGFDLRLDIPVDDEQDGALDEVEILKFLTADHLVRGGDRAHCAANFDAVKTQFDDVIAGLPTPLSHARVVEVETRHDAAHLMAASLADYNVSQDPTKLVYPVWRDPDVLDTWFSSGIWPIGTLGWPEKTPELAKYHPTSTLVTGFDIIFFWVARMMMMQLELHGEVPFRDVYIHALVRDEKGRKMSKSIGNVLDPIELIDEYGADAVRFTLSSMAAMGRDLKLSKDRIAGYRNFGTKLWNAARFAEMNECRFGADFDPTKVTQTPNKWIVGETGRVRETLDGALAAYRFNDASSALYGFVWGKVCDWYVEMAKPLFQDPETAEETRATMAWVLEQCVILMHPFMPFVTEALWAQEDGRGNVLALAKWPLYGADLIDADADDEMNWVISLIEEIRSVRAQMRVPAGAKIIMIELDLDNHRRRILDDNRSLVERLARIEQFEQAESAPKGAVTLAVGGATFCLPLAGVIDVGAERARLTKSLDKLAKEADKLRQKLDNPKFLANAKEDIVDKTRADLEERDEEIAILQAAVGRLASMAE